MAFNHSIIQSFNHSIIQSFNHSIIQSFNHSIIQAFKHSIKQRYPIVITFTKDRLKILYFLFFPLLFPLSLTHTAIFLKNLIP
ncbi:Hypothetical protein U063_1338 [Helicobacter pylori BM012A]|uniref:hypothetical protein n=1 Tax=Helicobacter pylori TaxID=210 RepID=UPI0003C7785E|nr:hypothetical protein [Helicobacter pylori]AHA88675.1 Hypothetical protein U063_1338 [Helicobacter pylori BM012A]